MIGLILNSAVKPKQTTPQTASPRTNLAGRPRVNGQLKEITAPAGHVTVPVLRLRERRLPMAPQQELHSPREQPQTVKRPRRQKPGTARSTVRAPTKKLLSPGKAVRPIGQMSPPAPPTKLRRRVILPGPEATRRSPNATGGPAQTQTKIEGLNPLLHSVDGVTAEQTTVNGQTLDSQAVQMGLILTGQKTPAQVPGRKKPPPSKRQPTTGRLTLPVGLVRPPPRPEETGQDATVPGQRLKPVVRLARRPPPRQSPVIGQPLSPRVLQQQPRHTRLKGLPRLLKRA